MVLGSGKRLFAEGAATSGFRLVDSEVTSKGVIHQVLQPAPLATGVIVIEGGEVLVQPE